MLVARRELSDLCHEGHGCFGRALSQVEGRAPRVGPAHPVHLLQLGERLVVQVRDEASLLSVAVLALDESEALVVAELLQPPRIEANADAALGRAVGLPL